MQRYDYKNVVTESKLFKEIIKLPATPDGQPDYAYMEEYMKKVETAVSAGRIKEKN